ncbi:MAG: WG repeat-containing protein [Bacteroidales bacterium]|nr:WG repeat-containing protein [Bacteroidales bacterium]
MTKSFQHVLALFCGVALCLSFTAQAQDLKPVKDKATKKYGYQMKGKKKVWVIQPQYDDAKRFVDGYAEIEVGGYTGLINEYGEMIFAPKYTNISKFDKFGLCELTRRTSNGKFHGIGDMAGNIIIPVEAENVSVDRYGNFLYAKYITKVPNFKPVPLWGVYDRTGKEVFEPQFSGIPSFREGVGIVKSGINGLYGMAGADGSILRPFKYLYIYYSSGNYEALGTDLSHHVWGFDLRSSSTMRQIGAVIPYDVKNDPVRLAAWHKGPVGERLHSNNVKIMETHMGYYGAQTACRNIPIDWGFKRFIRLEPCIVPAGTPDAMYYSTGQRYYTLKALLYEADGTFVREVCSRGWLEGDCAEGAIYNADGKERWMIFANPNTIALPAFTTDLYDYRPFGHSDIYEGLGISIQEMNELRSVYDFSNRTRALYEAENLGVSSYTPRIPSSVHARAEFNASRSPIFHYPFHMGEVVNCAVHEKDGKIEVELSDDLVCMFRDRISDPSYTFSEGPEVIYWGPNNARTVRLSLEAMPHSGNYTQDDLYGTGYAYMLVLNMYEEDGSWLRTLGAAPWVDFLQDGILVFEPLGIALISPFTGLDSYNKDYSHHQPQYHQPQSHSQSPSRSQTASRSYGTRVSGGARNSVAGAGTANQEPVSKAAPMVRFKPVPHSLSALESALRHGNVQ